MVRIILDRVGNKEHSETTTIDPDYLTTYRKPQPHTVVQRQALRTLHYTAIFNLVTVAGLAPSCYPCQLRESYHL
jgi:hypothetical protein